MEFSKRLNDHWENTIYLILFDHCFIVHLQMTLHQFCRVVLYSGEQCSKKRLFGANYSQHVLLHTI